MGLIREPKNVDFTVESKPWTEAELADFRKLMKVLKAKKKPVRKAETIKKERKIYEQKQ
jgi:hypothetical protein